MKKKKNDLKKLKLNKGVISHFEIQQVKGGTLLTTAVCTTTPVDLYSKFTRPCETGLVCTRICEPTKINCTGRVCL